MLKSALNRYGNPRGQEWSHGVMLTECTRLYSRLSRVEARIYTAQTASFNTRDSVDAKCDFTILYSIIRRRVRKTRTQRDLGLVGTNDSLQVRRVAEHDQCILPPIDYLDSL